MLLTFAVTTPLQICELVADSATAVLITVFGVTAVAMGEQQFTYSVTMQCGQVLEWINFVLVSYCLAVNRVATDLEEPFMVSANDLPCVYYLRLLCGGVIHTFDFVRTV